MWEALNDFSDFVLSPDDGEADVTDESFEEVDDDDTPKSDDDKEQSLNAKNDDLNSGDDHVDDNHVENDIEDNDDEDGASDIEEGDDNDDNDDNENRVFYMGGMGVGDFNDMLFRRTDDNEYDDDNSLEMTPEMEAAHRCELEETFTEPLLIDDGGNDADGSDDVLLDDDDDNDNGGNGHSSNRGSSGGDNEVNNTTNTTSVIAEENSESNNENPSEDNSMNADNDEEYIIEEEEESIDEDAIELKEIQIFLANFDIEAHTEEISQLLSSNNNTDADESATSATSATTPNLTPLQHHFQNLVPQTVSYPNFWKRYYYRCDPHRIALQWERQAHNEQLLLLQQQKERERALKEVSDAALSIGRSAASFLKGGWNVTSEAASDVIGGVGEVVNVTTEAAAGALVGVGDVVEEAASSLRVHQVKGRPLFVMGGMEEDDDSYYEDEDEEEIDLEEEEGEVGSSGWNANGGEDTKEEEIIHDDEAEEEGDEEVNFLEVSLLTDDGGLDAVRLRKSLMHAEEERNTLMQMVDERTTELSKLRSALLKQDQQHCPPVSGPARIHGLEREVEWLKHLVAATAPTDSSDARDTSVNALKSILIQMRKELLCQKTKPTDKSAISKSTLDSKAVVVRDLQSKIQALKNNTTPDNSPNIETLPESSEQDRLLREQLHQTNEKCNKLRLEIEETNQCIAQRQAQLQLLREKLSDKV